MKAADFALTRLRTKDGRLLRTYSVRTDGKPEAKINAYLDDYAYLVHGLICLHIATNDDRWLKEAKSLTDTMIKFHGDGERGGFFFAPSDGEKLFARPKDSHDGVQPSGNSMMALNLVQLWQKMGDEQYRKLAEKTLRQFAGVLKTSAGSAPTMGEALHALLELGGKKAETKTEPKSVPATKALKTADVVSAKAVLGTAIRDGKQAISITLKIEAPWHIYANPVGHDDLEGARTTIEALANGKKLSANFDYPKGTPEKDSKGMEYFVYSGEVTIKGTVAAKEDGNLEIKVKVQACTSGENGKCLLPATITVPVK